MEWGINIPFKSEGGVDFHRLENILSDKLSNNPQEDICICETSDRLVADNFKDYFTGSYDFNVAISYKKGMGYKIKFSTSLQNA